jgi:hypothetical protein
MPLHREGFLLRFVRLLPPLGNSKEALFVMRSSLYPCGTLVDTRNPVDYSRLKWTDVFVKSRTYGQTYNVSDMQYWIDVVGHVQYLGLPSYEYSSEGSPGGHPEGIEYYFALLDGGLAYHDFWKMRYGCQVEGRKCVRFLCYELGLEQPRKWRGEKSVPTRESLLAEIEFQQSDHRQLDVLRNRIEWFRESFRM